VISSSGNAAISASRYAAAAGIHLFVFVSEQTPLGKLAALTTENTTLILSSRPLRLAKYAAAHFDLPDLRPSVDGAAAIGFRSLGFELFEQQPEVANIFSFVTSGASLRGIHQAYEKLVALGAVDKIPKLFGVYSTGKLAGGLSGGGADRLASIQEICAQSGGALVEITDTEIESARTALTEQGIETSDESVASYAAAEKMKPVGQTVVVLTGKKWANVEVDLSKFQRAETFAEVDQLIQKYV
jgi:threonine synthase